MKNQKFYDERVLAQKNVANTLLISITTFLCSTVISFLAFSLLYITNNKRKQQIENKLNEDDK